MSLLWLAARNLASAPRRTLLMSLGLGTAVAVALLFFGFTRDTYAALAEVFARSGQGHLQVADAEWFDSVEPELHRTPMSTLREAEGVLAEGLGERVVASSLRREFTGMVTAGGRSGVVLGVGTQPEAEALLAPLTQPVAGRGLDQAPEGLLLGQPLAQRLGVGPGDDVLLLVTTDDGLTNAADFRVEGLIRTGVLPLDRTLARSSLESAQRLLSAEEADVLVIALRDTRDTDAALAEARLLLAGHPGLEVRPWYERARYYTAVKALYDRLFGVFQLLMLALAGLGLSHAVAAVVAQRRAEIGLLRVIGLDRPRLLSLFFLEGALLGLLGAATGALMAGLVALVTSALGGIPMPPPPGFADGYFAQFRLEPLGFLVVVPTAVLVASLASGLPALRTASGSLSRTLAPS